MSIVMKMLQEQWWKKDETKGKDQYVTSRENTARAVVDDVPKEEKERDVTSRENATRAMVEDDETRGKEQDVGSNETAVVDDKLKEEEKEATSSKANKKEDEMKWLMWALENGGK